MLKFTRKSPAAGVQAARTEEVASRHAEHHEELVEALLNPDVPEDYYASILHRVAETLRDFKTPD